MKKSHRLAQTDTLKKLDPLRGKMESFDLGKYSRDKEKKDDSLAFQADPQHPVVNLPESERPVLLITDGDDF